VSAGSKWGIRDEAPLNQAAGRLIRGKRDEAIQLFVGKGIKVWADRKKSALRDATAADIARKVALIPTDDLYAFYKQCEQARSFSRYFEWALKPRKQS
jgi:hypothetical protein